MKNYFSKLIIVLMFFFNLKPFIVFAGVPDNAFKALAVYNYFDAKVNFQKAKKSYPCLSGYGLALIYSRNDNPFYNLDSSYNKILESVDFYSLRKSKEAKYLAKYSIDSLVLINLKNKIEFLAFEKAYETKSIDTINHFISYYNLSALVPEAIEKRDSIAYFIALSKKDVQAMKDYMADYPLSLYKKEAKEKYEKLLYAVETKNGSAESYAEFIKSHPQSDYKEQAELKLYKLETEGKSDLQTYYNFINSYPNSSLVDEAWQKVYSIYRSENPGSSIPDFLMQYPGYIFKERLMEEYKLEAIDYLPYKQGNLWGFINASGEIVIEAKYDFVESFYEGIAIVSKGNKLGYITKTGEELVPPFYDEAENFHNSLAIVGEKEKYGVIDRNGKMLVPLGYEEIADYSEGLAVAFDGKSYGYINRVGAVIIPFRYEEAGEFSNGTAVCVMNELYGIIDSSGNEVIPFYYDAIENFSNGFARMRKEDAAGLVNSQGVIILNSEYDEIGEFKDNRAIIISQGKLGYLDLQGRISIPLTFKASPESLIKSEFINGFAAVKNNSGYTVIDTTGKRILSSSYEDIGMISENMVPVKKSGKWGFVNLLTQKIVIKPVYEKVLSFADGIAVVYSKGKAGIITKSGEFILTCDFEALVGSENGTLIAMQNGKIGLIDKNGFELVPIEYNQNSVVMNRYIKFVSDTSLLWYDTLNRKIFWKS